MGLRHARNAFLTSIVFLILVCVIAPQVILGESSRGRGEREARVIAGQYIVVLKDSVADADTAEADIVSRVRGVRLASYRSALSGFAARFSEADLAAVMSDPRVAFVSEDREVSIVEDVRGVWRDRRGFSPPPSRSGEHTAEHQSQVKTLFRLL